MKPTDAAAGEQAPAAAPLSIGLVSPAWPPGSRANGALTYVGCVAGGLERLGHRVTIVAHSVSDGAGGVEIINLKSGRVESPLVWRALRGLAWRVTRPVRRMRVRRRSPLERVVGELGPRGLSVVEVEEANGQAMPLIEAREVPVVVRLHGPWFLNGPAAGAPGGAACRARVRREGLVIGAAAGVTAPSGAVLGATAEKYPRLDLSGAEVIPNPIDPVEPAARWRADRAEPGRVLFVGRFDRHKGGDVALRAFAEVAKREPAARLAFIGPDRGVPDDRGRRWSFEQYVRAHLPAAARIDWLGPRSGREVAEHRRRAGVTIIPSRYETFGLTVTEAMAAGCPLVASAAGGIPEIVEDGVNGLLCRAGDAADLAEKVLTLLSDRELAMRLGERAAADCDRRYHPEVIAERTVAYYRRVIERWEGERGRAHG